MATITIRQLSVLLVSALTFVVVGCKTTGGDDETKLASLVDAYQMRKSAINSNYWIVDCENGIQETRHTDEIVAQKFCESVPVYQYFNQSRKEAKYSINGSEQSPQYGIRGVRFNVLKYAMTNEAGQPLTQKLTQCYNVQDKDWFLSTSNCEGPHEGGQRKEQLGFVLKANVALVGATMSLIRCVREATPTVGKDTRYSTDGSTCQPGFNVVGGPMGIVLKKFPTQTGGVD
jgi:hypothetical protein